MDAQTKRAKTLSDLAKAEFTDLSESEIVVLAAVALGHVAQIPVKSSASNEQSEESKWDCDNPVRAKLISWLCIDDAASALVSHAGISISGAYIDGQLDLSRSTINFNLSILNCFLSFPPIFAFAEIQMLDLRHTHMPGLDCRWIRVKNGVYLSKTTIQGTIVLTSATIGVCLDLSGAVINGLKGVSINANKIRLDGDMHLGEDFCSVGSVLLYGASITGDLNFDSGRIECKSGNAIVADAIQVGGEFNLVNGFHAIGQVRLLGASIEGSLCFAGGKISNPGGRALDAQRATVKNGVFLNQQFIARGEVRLLELTTRGNLDCSGGTFENEGGSAIVADGGIFGGAVFLNNGFVAHGEVRFVAARINGQMSCENGHFYNKSGISLHIDSATIQGIFLLGRGFESYGEVRISGSSIGQSVVCSGAKIVNEGGTALGADGVNINGNLCLNKGFEASGEVRVLNSTIDGQIDFTQGRFLNAAGIAISLDGTRITGDVFLRDGVEACGHVSLVHVYVEHGLAMTNIESSKSMTLNLSFSHVGTLWDDEKGWPRLIMLDGFQYSRLETTAPQDAKTRIRWLSLQPRFLPQPYEQLAHTLQRMGLDDDAKQVLIEKEECHRRQTKITRKNWWRTDWWWYNTLGRLIAYGYRPGNALLWSLAFVFFGFMIFGMGYRYEIITEIDTGANGASQVHYSDRYPAFSALMYSLDTFVPIIDFGQEAYWTPNPHRRPIRGLRTPSAASGALPSSARNWGWWLRTYLWIHIAAGWTLTTLLVLGFTGVVRR